MADAILQYRNKVVRLKPGHSAALPCYKKEMQGRVIVKAEPNEDGSIVPDGTKLITENGEADVAVFEKANVQVLPDEDVEITPTEKTEERNYDPTKKGIKYVKVNPILTESPTFDSNGVKTPSDGKYFKQVTVNVLPDEVLPVVPTEEDKTYYYDTTKKGIKQVNVAKIVATELYADANDTYTPKTGEYFKSVQVNVTANETDVGNLTFFENRRAPDDPYNVVGIAGVYVDVVPDQDVEITPTEKTEEQNYDPTKKGIKYVKVNPILTESPTFDSNGVKTPSNGKYFKQVTVNVLPDEVLPVVPTEAVQTLYYDTTKKGIKQVNVSAIQAGGLDIDERGVSFIPLERRFSGSFTPSAGSYYKKVDLSIPLPIDYIKPEDEGRELKTNNTEYYVTKDKKVTVKLPMQVDKAITPSEAVQTVSCDVDGNNYQGMQSVKVAAIQIHTPEVVTTPTATVTAPQGKYIKQVQVSVPTVAVYSGTSEPDNSIGKDGDIYLVLEG